VAFDKGRKIITDGALELGIVLRADKLAKTELFYDLLLFWNRSINLTTVTDEEEFATTHFLDSLLYLKGFPDQGPSLKVLDVGTGAGFPAIPIKIAFPDLDILLLEPSFKKTSFLHTVNSKLNLQMPIVEKKVVDWLKINSERRFDLIVMRAVGKLEKFVKELYPALLPTGRIIVSMGPADIPLKELPNYRLEVLSAPLPGTAMIRTLFIFHKKGNE